MPAVHLSRAQSPRIPRLRSLLCNKTCPLAPSFGSDLILVLRSDGEGPGSSLAIDNNDDDDDDNHGSSYGPQDDKGDDSDYADSNADGAGTNSDGKRKTKKKGKSKNSKGKKASLHGVSSRGKTKRYKKSTERSRARMAVEVKVREGEALRY